MREKSRGVGRCTTLAWPGWKQTDTLKVPKREIFVTELFTLSDPIWIGDMRIEPKNLFV